jgi:hypothetical protein
MKRTTTRALALAALACLASVGAHAEPTFHSRGHATQGADGGGIARSARAVEGSRGKAAGQRAIVADGQGNVKAAGAGGFTTESGAQGYRSGSFTRNEDGTASGQRSTTVTNADGKTFEGSTTYEQGSGVTRSATCKDAAGNTVSCGNK